MKAFVIGASGLVGSHILSEFKKNGWDVIGTHLNFKTEVTVAFDFSKESLDDFLLKFDFKPDIIIHCAALTNVDFCENNVDASYHGTVLPTETIVNYCERNQVKLAFISTDYVFDGASGPYKEDALVNPINVYGKHKLACEELVSKLNQHLILRITNVYGEEIRAKNFVARLIEDANANVNKELNLPFDQFATPIYAGDIARMTFQLSKDNKSGIFHLSSTDYYNRFQLANKVMSYFKNADGIKIAPTKTSNTNQAAQRPLYGGLLNTKFIEEYPGFTFENVDSFMQKVTKNEL